MMDDILTATEQNRNDPDITEEDKPLTISEDLVNSETRETDLPNPSRISKEVIYGLHY